MPAAMAFFALHQDAIRRLAFGRQDTFMLGNTDRWMTAYRTFCGKNSPEKAGGNFPVPPESGLDPVYLCKSFISR
jgi:hypothetical protein